MSSSMKVSTLFPLRAMINYPLNTLFGKCCQSSNTSKMEKAAYKLLYIQIKSQADRNNLAALFLQATEGSNETPEPQKGTNQDVEIWNAWKQLGKMSKVFLNKRWWLRILEVDFR